eukprot:scaffold332_cov117-Cylindrotheca_fusiformis.AAC.3
MPGSQVSSSDNRDSSAANADDSYPLIFMRLKRSRVRKILFLPLIMVAAASFHCPQDYNNTDNTDNNKSNNNRKHHQTSGIMESVEDFTVDLVRMVVLSDTHGHHHHMTSRMPDGNILIHLGDFCNKGSKDDALDFAEWITNQANDNYAEVFVIDGNHDRTLNSSEDDTALNLSDLFSKATAATNGRLQFLQDELVTTKYHGLKLFGASWASCEEGKFPQQFQEPLDVMLAHVNPRIPNEHFPTTMDPKSKGGWRGKRELFQTVQDNRIPLCLTGHVHWSRGAVQCSHDGTNNSTFINAATMKSQRKGVVMNEPVVIDYDLKKRRIIQTNCPLL